MLSTTGSRPGANTAPLGKKKRKAEPSPPPDSGSDDEEEDTRGKSSQLKKGEERSGTWIRADTIRTQPALGSNPPRRNQGSPCLWIHSRCTARAGGPWGSGWAGGGDKVQEEEKAGGRNMTALVSYCFE